MVVCVPSLVFSFGPKLNNDKNETVVGKANPPGMGNEESRN